MSATAERFTRDRPYPVAALARAIGLDADDPHLTSKLVARLGLDRRWVRRCRRLGLTVAGADHWATLCGLHPAQVWPEWGAELGEDDGWYADDPSLDEVAA